MSAWISGWQEALSGWTEWKAGGKLTALLLAALLYLFFAKDTKKEKSLIELKWYAAVGAVLCICPVTAALLMCYQTRFYGYAWIWSCVPLTIVTACGGVLFFGDISKGRKVAGCLLLLAILALCGNWRVPEWRTAQTSDERMQAQHLLEAVKETVGEEEICLWAPKTLMEYARAYDGEIRLLYGRDMWDGALKAYSYEIYSEEKTKLYHWMEETDGGALTEEEMERAGETARMLERAREQGVNCVVLSDTLDEESLQSLEESEGWRSRTVDGYYLFFCER